MAEQLNFRNMHRFARLLLSFVSTLIFSQVIAEESICYGTTVDGWLENGVQLPRNGSNFVGYSDIARMAGRTYVHDQVREIVVGAYKVLQAEQPTKVYKYGETGFEAGGEFEPHKTHRNGLSVDFFVPVIDDENRSVHLPTHPFNKFGYSLEFDATGRLDSFRIDYDAMAAHIVALHKTALAGGFGLQRVIFDPQMQQYLYQTDYGDFLRDNIIFFKGPVVGAAR